MNIQLSSLQCPSSSILRQTRIIARMSIRDGWYDQHACLIPQIDGIYPQTGLEELLLKHPCYVDRLIAFRDMARHLHRVPVKDILIKGKWTDVWRNCCIVKVKEWWTEDVVRY